MTQERLLKILLAPIVSEKTNRLGEKHRQYAFRVATDASKLEIKAAVEKLFNVSVEHVRVNSVKARYARFGQIQGQHKAWKKAYVALKEGHEIQFANVGG